jgi:hypothetical protein
MAPQELGMLFRELLGNIGVTGAGVVEAALQFTQRA